MDKIKVMVLEDDLSRKAELESILSSIDYILFSQDAETHDDVMRILDLDNVDVILLSSGFLGDGYKLAEEITFERPDKSVIILENELKEETMHKALFSGAKDVVIRPIRATDLMGSIYKVYELNKMKSEVHRDSNVRVRRKSELGQVITVFSTKGGVGKTFVSINLAVTLSRETKKRVVIIDLDPDLGTVSITLNLQPKYTISDVVNDIRNLDPDLMESYLLTHSSGVKVLPANLEPLTNNFINAEHIQIILRNLQNSYDYIIVDMPNRFYDPINPAFVFADKLLMVTTPEVSTVRNVKASLLTLSELNYPKSKIKLILNRADRSGEIKARDVEKTLDQSIYATIDADYKGAILSLNQGVPYVIKNPRSSISKGFKNLAKKVTDNTVESPVAKQEG